MSEAVEFARWVSTGLFILLAVITSDILRRRRNEQAAWAFATFAALGLVTVLGRVLPEDPPEFVTKLNVLLLIVFPWALFRFTASLRLLSVRDTRIGDVAVAGLVLWTLLIPPLPAAGEPRSAAIQAFVIGFVVIWVGLLVVVGWRLWRAGKGQPTLARRRMRLLASGATAMGLAVVGAAFAPTTEGDPAALIVQLLAIVSAVGFGIGFAPPAWLRTAWRQPEERELYATAVRLLTVTHEDEIPPMILPRLASVVGARAAVIVDPDGDVAAKHGQLPEASNPTLRVPAGTHTVHVWPSPYAPFFGDEEERLLRRMALLTGLGLERAAAISREREARASTEAVNRELEAFVYSASHDLKSPLIAILGYLSVFEDDYGSSLDDQAKWYVDRMKANGAYMEALINDLLELSRVGRVETERTPVPFGELAIDVATEVGRRHPEATIRVGQLPVLWFNPARARQLLTNLVENACRYGGRPDVQVHVSAVDGDPDGLELIVEDDGVGIPEGYREQVFGVFERLAPEPSSGTGIGLAICAKIVGAAGGSIRAEEGDLGGARFVISLPESSRVGSQTLETEVRR